MKPYLRHIDTKTSGNRYDITPLFLDFDSLSGLISDLSKPFEGDEINYVAGIDALGFILGAAIAMGLKKGFIAVRKGGKLPVVSESVEFVDYSNQVKSLELRKDAIKPGDRILLVDEWVETGAQVRAAIELIENQGGVIVGIASINFDDNEVTRMLNNKYKCSSVWEEE